MQLTNLLTDSAILAEIGRRLARRRVDLQLSQEHAAKQAGLGKRTLERIEAGKSAQFSSLLRLFRVLDLLHDLERAIPEVKPSPMDLLKHRRKMRKRATKKGRTATEGKRWTWDEGV